MVSKDDVLAVMRTINDPEIPLNVVDLGLVYDIRIDGPRVEIDMTLTAIGCPAAVYFPSEVKARVEQLDGVDDAKVNIVWNPPWSIQKVTEEGKLFLESLGIRTSA